MTTGNPEPGAEVSPRWIEWRRRTDLDRYDRRWEDMVARGESVHGEIDFVERAVAGAIVDLLDAGCGTGRLAIEAHRRGHRCVGVDLDRDMIERARTKAPSLEWHHADLATVDLGRDFDVVVMAGNIPLFCAPGSQATIVANLARHLRTGGRLICGFSLENGPSAYRVSDFVRDAENAGLTLESLHPAWDAPPIAGASTSIADEVLDDYAVVVCRRDAP